MLGIRWGKCIDYYWMGWIVMDWILCLKLKLGNNNFDEFGRINENDNEYGQQARISWGGGTTSLDTSLSWIIFIFIFTVINHWFCYCDIYRSSCILLHYWLLVFLGLCVSFIVVNICKRWNVYIFCLFDINEICGIITLSNKHKYLTFTTVLHCSPISFICSKHQLSFELSRAEANCRRNEFEYILVL